MVLCLQMITHSSVIATVLVVDALALLLYNVSGMCVTGHLGAVFRWDWWQALYELSLLRF